MHTILITVDIHLFTVPHQLLQPSMDGKVCPGLYSLPSYLQPQVPQHWSGPGGKMSLPGQLGLGHETA